MLQTAEAGPLQLCFVGEDQIKPETCGTYHFLGFLAVILVSVPRTLLQVLIIINL